MGEKMRKNRQPEQSKREAALLWWIEQLQKLIQRLFALVRIHFPEP